MWPGAQVAALEDDGRELGTFGPERRTIPMPPRPGGVAAATMVSVRVIQPLNRGYRLQLVASRMKAALA